MNRPAGRASITFDTIYGRFNRTLLTRDMRSRTQYVPRGCVSELRRRISSYESFKSLTEQWIDSSIEHSRLRMKIERAP